MPRQLRIEYPGAIYHVLNRGDRREPIFRNDGDCHEFLKTLGEAALKARWEIHAYCLMKNHFHLVIETPESNLSVGMRWLLSTYSNRFNRRHGLTGHVFGGRYKALVVEGSGNGYLRTVCDYTHLNPVRARLLQAGHRLLEYPWSSFGLYLTEPRHRPAWLRVDRLLGEHGIARDDAEGRRELERRLEVRRQQEADAQEWQTLRRGWCLGSQAFRKSLLNRLQVEPAKALGLREEVSQNRAETIVAKELRRCRWKEADLARRKKLDERKLAIAARLRQETTMTIAQIAERLHMGTRKSLAAKLHKWKKQNS